MKRSKQRLFQRPMAFALLIFVLGACAPQSTAIEPGILPTEANSVEENGDVPMAGDTISAGPITLKVWLPPVFSNFSGEDSSILLQERLDLFHELNPNVQIEIRLKSNDGSGSMIESWMNASEAAPIALPDLVLLDNDQFEEALGAGLINPLDGSEQNPLDLDYFSFARQLVERDGQRFGYPFAGDLMILMHRFSAIEQPPARWSTSLTEPLVIAFAAADPNASVPLLQMQSLQAINGQNQESDPLALDSLSTSFNYFAEGQSTGVFPFWLAQLENEEQSWQAFLDGRSPMVVTWSQRYFLSQDENQGGAAIPSIDGSIRSYAQSWAWAVGSKGAERREIAKSLADFLTDAEFLAQWSAAAGLVPARESSLVAWAPSQKQALALEIAPQAELFPSLDYRSQFSLAIRDGLVGLLKSELSANEAILQIEGAVQGP